MPAAQPTRRTVLRGALGLAGVAALAGCTGERLRTPWSPDAPTTGAEPPVDLPPDAELMLAARERLHRYRAVLAHVRADTSGGRRAVDDLRELWPVQQERLEQLLTLAGVDLPDLPEVPVDLPAPEADDAAGTGDASSTGDAAGSTGADPGEDGTATTAGDDESTTAGDDAAATSAAPPGLEREVLGAALREDLPSAVAGLAGATATNRAMLTSLVAQHAEAARLMRAPVEWPPLAGPTGASAVPILQVTRPAAFGLEVVAARARGEERALYETVLRNVRSITRGLTTLAGDAAPVPPLGYDLPEPLDDEEDRLALARSLVHDVAPAALGVVDRAGTDVAQLESVVRIVVEAASWGRILRAPVEPFPGMTLP